MAVKFIGSIQRYVGLAADTKPTGVPVGSEFYEYDTRIRYITYDGTLWTTYTQDLGEVSISTSAAVMSDGLEIFQVAGGPIEMKTLVARCVTDNNATASTLLFYADPTAGAATDICGASASLANATAGTIVNLVGNALATAAVVSANGTAISQLFPILIPVGTMNMTVGVGSTTGTWMIHMRYMPLAVGVVVTASY
jgi:hypothetical protein